MGASGTRSVFGNDSIDVDDPAVSAAADEYHLANSSAALFLYPLETEGRRASDTFRFTEHDLSMLSGTRWCEYKIQKDICRFCIKADLAAPLPLMPPTSERPLHDIWNWPNHRERQRHKARQV
jgi:hypothetical protein